MCPGGLAASHHTRIATPCLDSLLTRRVLLVRGDTPPVDDDALCSTDSEMRPMIGMRMTSKSVTPLGRRIVLAVCLSMLLTASLGSPPPVQASDTITRWEHFSESSGCETPYTKTPYASKQGTLYDSEPILGPSGTYFGRTIGEVRSRLVYWTVPYSGGRRVQVHEAALPAFNQVAARLVQEAAAGRIYPINKVSSFVPRTVGGSYAISRHSFGTAIDFNPKTNPYRGDGTLITDMPDWFVDAWRDAGFCWGGDWLDQKDAMHFAWIGPSAGTESLPALNPIPPRTALADLGAAVDTVGSPMAPVMGRYELMIGDATGNAAPDVVGLRAHPDGAVLDIAQSTRHYDYCSIDRWFIPDTSVLGASHTLLMDTNGDSRQDLVTLHANGSSFDAVVATRQGEFEDVTSNGTSVPAGSVAVAGADFDGDHLADIWSVTDDGTLRVYKGPDWNQLILSSSLPSGAPLLIAAGDRDGGDTPELFALYANSDASKIEVLRDPGDWAVDDVLALSGPASAFAAMAAADYDGDGRSDLQTLDDAGVFRAHLGNTSTGVGATRWFVNPLSECEDRIVLDFDGSFYDDDDSVHHRGIDFMASRGITFGCNPPYNDMYCPETTLTRAHAAAFLARALDLPDSPVDHFVDDDGHVLEPGINRLAQAGVPASCELGDEYFCPDRVISRAEFALFIVTAVGLPESSTDFFVDDDGHPYEDSINALAEAGITFGCNPPDNDWFCPERSLTRAEAATFMYRLFR